VRRGGLAVALGGDDRGGETIMRLSGCAATP